MRIGASTRTGRGISGNNRPGAVRPVKVKPIWERPTKVCDPLAPSILAASLISRKFQRKVWGRDKTLAVLRAEGKCVFVLDEQGLEEKVSADNLKKRLRHGWKEVQL